METVKRSVVARGGVGRGRDKQVEHTEDFKGSETTLYGTIIRWIHVNIHLSKPTECSTPRVNRIANYGLWVIMTRGCGFIDCTNIPICWGY